MRIMRTNIRPLAFVLLAAIIIALFFQASSGYAQEASPTETPIVETTKTPVSTENADITTTATYVPIETQTHSTEIQETSKLLIKISRNARLANVMVRMDEYGHVVESEELAKLGIFILEVPTYQLDEKISELRNISGVGWVEPDYPVQALETIPNDPSFPTQYALTAIHAPQGWDISTGSSAITIAVLDSGVDLSHPDLAGKIVQGYDFVNNDNNPQDDYGHGTHVAGIAAASSNNGLGVAGVSWGANIMPVKVLNSTGAGSFSNVASGVVWATDHGAQVINMSLGGTSFSQTLEDAITYAASRDVFMAAASGNSNASIVLYPARSSQVMAVAATDANNQRASFSNYGPEIEIAAPGDAILSIWPGGGYNTLSGTSMATPFVSGLAAILFEYENNATLIRQYLKQSALDIAPAGSDIYTGAGLIQMDAALQLVLPAPTQTMDVGPNPAPGVRTPFQAPAPLWIWTQTPLATFTAVSVVSAAPSLSVVSSTPQLTSSPQIENSPVAEVQALAVNRDSSPLLPCAGIIFILVGLFILYFYRKYLQQRDRGAS